MAGRGLGGGGGPAPPPPPPLHSGTTGAIIIFFTREYTKCTAGSTFCFVVVVLVLVGKPLIKLASISADS
jgi:hypothetical protein